LKDGLLLFAGKRIFRLEEPVPVKRADGAEFSGQNKATVRRESF
jgi:hypothetical protein